MEKSLEGGGRLNQVGRLSSPGELPSTFVNHKVTLYMSKSWIFSADIESLRYLHLFLRLLGNLFTEPHLVSPT